MRACIAIICIFFPLTVGAVPAGTAFTYQGELWSAGQPADGEFDLTFELFDADSGGTSVGMLIQRDDVQVDGGLINTTLDFGAGTFLGEARWLEIGIREGASTDPFTTLAPRSLISPMPYALFALDGNPGPQGATGPPGPAGDSHWELVGNDTFFDSGLVGVGESTPIVPVHVQSADLAISTTEAFNTDIAVESDDAVLSLFSSGGGGYGSALTLAEMTGGGLLDSWTAVRRTSQAGSELWFSYGSDPNYSLNDRRFVLAPNGSAALGASPVLSDESTLTVESLGDNFGVLVQAQGVFGSAIGLHAGPAGFGSVAKNAFFDAGWQRFDTNNGAFLMETAPNGTTTFFTGDPGANPLVFEPTLVLASGDATVSGTLAVGTGTVLTSVEGFFGFNRADAQFPIHVGDAGTNGNGARLTEGGTWTDASSRLFKTDLQAISPQDILDRVLQLPVLRWRYTDSNEGFHLGPMAEDFHALFGLGDTEQYIAGVDRNGVALAAIQGLHEKLQNRDARIAELERINSENQRALARAIERIERLEENR